jgi:hypothetical protein
LTGDAHVLERVMETIRTADPSVLVRPLGVECAYHSGEYLSMGVF